MKRKLLIVALLGFVAIIIGLVTLPAHVAWRLARGYAPNVQLFELSGTLWSGRAERTLVADKELGRLAWHIPFVNLLTSKPTVLIKLEGAAIDLEANAQKLSGQTVLRAVTASADASWLAPAIGIPAVMPTGKLAANFGELVLDARGTPIRAQGNLQWMQAGVSGLAQAEFGSFDIAIENDPAGGIKGNVRPIGQTTLDISGAFSLRNQDYSAEFTLRPNHSDPNLARALEMIGQPMTGVAGARILKIKGKLVLPQ